MIVKELLDLMESIKVKLTLNKLIKNAKKVLKRDHLVDRKIKILKTSVMVGVKSLRIDAEAHGEKLYIVTIIFYNVSFSKTKDDIHTVPINMPDNKRIYAEVLDSGKHPVRVWCGGSWFQFACFTGDILIPLPNGYSVPIKELVGREKFNVYSYDTKNNKRVIGKGQNCQLIKENEPVVKITLDNGSSFKCDYNQKFMLKNGSYVKAINLKPMMSLKPHLGYENHKVVSVEKVGCEDVYCFQVSEFSNFAIDVGNGVDCSSGVFVHNCEWYLHQFGSLVPKRKPRPYKKVPGSTRPSINPERLPCLCKHVYQLALQLQDRGILKNLLK